MSDNRAGGREVRARVDRGERGHRGRRLQEASASGIVRHVREERRSMRARAAILGMRAAAHKRTRRQPASIPST
jgi:hypothetical protein